MEAVYVVDRWYKVQQSPDLLRDKNGKAVDADIEPDDLIIWISPDVSPDRRDAVVERARGQAHRLILESSRH